MSLLSKRLVSITASTVLLSLVSAGANAQGTWYTDFNAWSSLVTNVQTATYDIERNNSAPWIENGVTATFEEGVNWYKLGVGALSPDTSVPVAFTFTGNAFGGLFAMVDINDDFVADGMNFSVDGSVTNVYSITSPSAYNTYQFLGYISDSASPISVTVRGDSTPEFLAVNSFSFGNGTNASNPGSNVAPEPGTFALALTGGAALIGICNRRRRNAA